MSDTSSVVGDFSSKDLSCPQTVEKYMVAAGIANETLQIVIDACKVGANIADICTLGDKTLEEKFSKVYNKLEDGKKVPKGISFPTCISVNEICGHYSPLTTAESAVLGEGDLVKIDLGGQIDGYIACVAHSILLEGGDDRARKADAINAAWNSQEAALRTLADGVENHAVTSVIGQCAEAFECEPLQGVLSHQMKQHVIGANKCIISKITDAEKVDTHVINTNEVYCLDMLMSSGEGKPKECDDIKTTVFKRDLELNHQLKTQKGRQFISEVGRRFPTVPFCLRSIEDQTAAKVGIVEGLRHGLFDPYPVLSDKTGYVAHFKCTVLMLGGGAKKVTGIAFDAESCKSEKKIENEELVNLLKKSMDKKKKKKNNKKK